MRSPRARLGDIATAIQDIQTIVAGADTVPRVLDLLSDRIKVRAVLNAFMEIGEASRALPDDIRNRHPGVNWRGIIGLRNLIAHRYFIVDPARIAAIIVQELPDLSAIVDRERAALGPEGDE